MRVLGTIFVLLAITLLTACVQKETKNLNTDEYLSPEELYGELFYDVQNDHKLFYDSKTFVDAVPLEDPAKIREAYAVHTDRSTEGLRRFLGQHFLLPSESVGYVSEAGDVSDHIKKLWTVLRRNAFRESGGTLLPLPCNYIVPGGRFREIYYWDSYFTMLGLKVDGEYQTICDMLCNFESAIDNLGFIPNGNRTYYLSRSQPPFFSLMVKLQEDIPGGRPASSFVSQLKKEYAFWMRGSERALRTRKAEKRVVVMPGGELLNRYYDTSPRPRPESYLEDQKTLQEAQGIDKSRSSRTVFTDIRAAAESGWDFSSRWLVADSNGVFRMGTIRTTEIVPVDLNCLLYHLELTIAEIEEAAGTGEAAEWRKRCEERKKAILKYHWSEAEGFFMDYDRKVEKSTPVLSLAGTFPLFFGIADSVQAGSVAARLRADFLQQGGLLTTLHVTGQQWDAPNGWAPLHYIACMGLKSYGHFSLEHDVRQRWMRLIEKTYAFNGRILEKYNVQDTMREGGGGEYPNQDGFGWTNGVYQYFRKEQTSTQ